MANLDTALKRLSGIHPLMPWRASYPIPDGTISRADRQVIPRLYSGILATSTPTTATISGTAVSGLTEAQVVAGGQTIVITLAHDTWVASGATFDAQRQAIINGLTSAQSELHGWNNDVRDALTVNAVARTSDTVVTVTLEAEAAYNITVNETVTVTVPSSALTNSAVDVTATPTFTVTAFVPVSTEQPISNWQAHRHPRNYRTRQEAEEATREERVRLGIIPREYDARKPVEAPELVNPPAPEPKVDRAEAPLLPQEIAELKAAAKREAKAELDEYRRLILKAQEEQDIAFVAALLAADD